MSEFATYAAQALKQRYGQDVPVPEQWNPVLSALLSHHSVRRFLDAPVSNEQLSSIVAAAQSAPTSSNLQVWSVIAVRDPSIKDRLSELAAQQEFIRQAPLFLVWVVDYSRVRQLAERHGTRVDGLDFFESAVLGSIDTGLAAQNALVAAESLGLGGVFVGAIRNKTSEVAELLGLPDNVAPLFGQALGVPDPQEQAGIKPRLPQTAVLHHDRYDASQQLTAIDTYEDRIASYYEQYQLDHSWITRVLARLADAKALHGRDQLKTEWESLGFQLR